MKRAVWMIICVLLSGEILAKEVQQYTTNIQFETAWEYSEKSAESMAKAIARNRMSDECKRQGYAGFMNEEERAYELHDLYFNVVSTFLGGREQYKARGSARAWCYR